MKKIITFYPNKNLKNYLRRNKCQNNIMLNIEKARKTLGWTPTLSAKDAIKNTVEWYKHFYDKDCDMHEFTIKQIEDYEKKYYKENHHE